MEIYAHQLTYFQLPHAFPFAKSQFLDFPTGKAVSTENDECKVHLKSFSCPSVSFVFVMQSIRECQYSYLYMVDMQIYWNFLTPKFNCDQFGRFSQFFSLSRTDKYDFTTCWYCTVVVSLSQRKGNFIPSFRDVAISFPLFLE